MANDEYGLCEATLTTSGLEKLSSQTRGEPQEFIPGIDYRVLRDEGNDWLAFPAHVPTATLRHDWVLSGLRRPLDPIFAGVLMPRKGEKEID